MLVNPHGHASDRHFCFGATSRYDTVHASGSSAGVFDLPKSSFLQTLFCLMLPFAAQAEYIVGSDFGYGNWNGAGYTDDQTGEFSHCAVSAGYVSGDTLYFSVNRSATVTVGVESESIRQLNVGANIPVSLYVDRRQPFYGTATVILDNFAILDILDLERALETFKRGYGLTVEGGGMRGSYDLAGTYRALDRVLECAVTYYDYRKTPPQQPNVSSNSVDKSEMFALATMIISDLGIQSFRYLSNSELSEKGWDSAVGWSSPENGISGLALIVDRGQIDELRSSDAGDTEFLARSCAGDYAVSARTLDGGSAREIRLLCETSGGLNELYLAKAFAGQSIVYSVLNFDAEFGDRSANQGRSAQSMNEQAATVAASFIPNQQ